MRTVGPATAFLVKTVVVLVAVTVVTAAGLAWRLSTGPLALGFLTPYLEEALNLDTRARYRVAVNETILTWGGWQRTLDIRGRGLKVVTAAGEVALALPEVAVSLSSAGLLSGRLDPTGIDVFGADVRVLRLSDGSLSLGLGSPDAAPLPGRDDAIAVFINDFLASEPGTRFAGLRRISIVNSGLTVVDRADGTVWRAPNLNLVLQRVGAQLRGEADFDLALDGRRVPIAGRGTYDSATGTGRATATFGEVVPAQVAPLAKQIPALTRLQGINVPIRGGVGFAFTAAGVFSELTFELAAGAGTIDLPDVFARRIAIVRAAAQGRASPALDDIRIDKATVDLGAGAVEIAAEVKQAAGGTAIAADLKVRGLPARDLPAYWPKSFAGEARTWVERQVTAGEVGAATIAVRSAADGALTFAIDFDFRDLGVRYLPTLPPIVDAAGKGRLKGDRIEIEFARGRTQAIELLEGTVAISKIFEPRQQFETGFVARGTLGDALALLDHEPLKVARLLGVQPSQVQGGVAARVRIAFPMIDNVATPVEAIDYAAAANLAGVAIAGLSPRFRLSEGELKLRLDRQGMDIEGEIAINGVRATATWREDFRAAATYNNQYILTARIDDAARARLGIDLGRTVTGPINVHTQILGKDRAIKQIALDINLQNAALDFAALHWRKAPQSPGTARATMSLGPTGSFVVDTFAVETPDLRAYGSLELSSDGNKLVRLDLTRLAYGHNLVAASVRPHSKSGYVAAITGERFDFTPYLAELATASEAGEGQGPPIEISMNVKEVLLAPARKLANVRAVTRSDGRRWTEADVAGTIENGKTMRLRMAPAGASSTKRDLILTANDAGGLLRTLGFFENAIGGDIDITGTVDDARSGAVVSGRIEARGFTVVRAPTLARILTVGSLEGILEILRGRSGIEFVGFDSRFTLENGALALEGGRAYGPALGITVDGKVGFIDESVGFEGAVIPAYNLNSILGNIPILGNILVGRRGEGVFALNYRVKGPADNPDVQVNPLSALAPGILRRFFDLLERPAPGGAAPPAPAGSR
jgi:hypothetical protein